MDVRATTRIRAVLRIYRMHRKPRGGVLDLPRLERDWRHTGLRRSDLDLALHDMVEQHLLLPRVNCGIPVYELTYLGARSMSSLLASLSAEGIHDWLILLRAKKRAGHSAPLSAAAHRRRSDRGPASDPDAGKNS